jgi:hypothetical protein
MGRTATTRRVFHAHAPKTPRPPLCWPMLSVPARDPVSFQRRLFAAHDLAFIRRFRDQWPIAALTRRTRVAFSHSAGNSGRSASALRSPEEGAMHQMAARPWAAKDAANGESSKSPPALA